MSSAGATLQGSYSDATGEVTETGFYYGTSSGSLTTRISTNGSASPFSTVLADLTPGTTYYYKAFVKEGDVERSGSEKSFTTKSIATATVTTNAASGIRATNAVLSGSYSGATGAITETGFYWGTSSTSLTNELYVGDGSGDSGSFTKTLEGLLENTTYYFKAYVLEWNEGTNSYEYKYGAVKSFKTKSATASSDLGYLECYEVPAIPTLNGSETGGTFSDRDDVWKRYYTTNSKQQVATHSYTHPDSNKRVRNYTVFYDESRYAPLWCAHAMHKSMWPSRVSRQSGWIDDPAISLTQQGGLDNASTIGYSRGHLVSSGERLSTVKQNKQTFYHSNQAPQRQNKFNGSIWSSMEDAIIAAAPSVGSTDTLYVVTGVLYEYSGSPTTKPSGSLNVPIPTHFYKCAMLCSFDSSGNVTAAKGIAYLFENKDYSNNDYSVYATTIDVVESRAGFDFFPRIPEALQTKAENGTNPLSL